MSEILNETTKLDEIFINSAYPLNLEDLTQPVIPQSLTTVNSGINEINSPVFKNQIAVLNKNSGLNCKPVSTDSIPVPATPLGDFFSRLIECGNDRRGRAEKFILKFQEEHPFKPGEEPIISLETRQDTKGKLECLLRVKCKQRGPEITGVQVKFDDEVNLDGESGPASKLLQLIFSKILSGCFSIREDRLHRTEVQVNIDEILTLGIFSSPHSARRHMDQALKKIGSIWVKVKTRAEDGSRITSYTPLIGKFVTDQSRHWKVQLDPDVSCWISVMYLYCNMPTRSFLLSNKSFSLVRYIMQLANMHAPQIRRDGFFVLTVRAIAERLLLNLNDKRKLKEKVVDPLKKLFSEINENGSGVRLETETLGNSTQSFLDGKVKIYVSEDLLRKFSVKKLTNKKEKTNA